MSTKNVPHHPVELTDHKVTGADAGPTLHVMATSDVDKNACRHYTTTAAATVSDIFFQKGSIKEGGVNGITNEVLVNIVLHRLQVLQSGKFPCQENEEAIALARDLLATLKRRTENRVSRGVAGVPVK